MDVEAREPDNGVKMKRNSQAPYKRDGYIENVQTGISEQNQNMRENFSYEKADQRNMAGAKNDILNTVVKSEMDRLMDNKEGFYELLNTRVTQEFKILPTAAEGGHL